MTHLTHSHSTQTRDKFYIDHVLNMLGSHACFGSISDIKKKQHDENTREHKYDIDFTVYTAGKKE